MAELERTLDLWASMWLAEERVQFERALERVVDGDVAQPLKAAAVAACRIIGTPRLLGAGERAAWFLEDETLAQIEAVAAPLARILRHAGKQDRAGVAFLVDKAVRDPHNRVAGKLLDRVDIRELYSVMSLSFDDEHRVEAAAHIARRGPHQRARLLAALDLAPDAFEAALAIDVPLDDLDARDGVDEGIADGAWLPVNLELSLSA
ncbi:MAG: hypothetical protein LC659_14485 [Myxococcales bacterium]|nr:hypothetical protein [Myxococcales bacterium]